MYTKAMEEIIDTVQAYCLEVGDLIMDPYTGVIREVSGFYDDGTEIHVMLEDDDEPTIFTPDAELNLYGYTTVEV